LSIWFFLWLILSLALVYFMGWTAWILFRQKQVWKAFSVKHKLRYSVSGFTGSPEMSGEYQGYEVSLFTGEHVDEDGRGSRKLTAIEVRLKSDMPFEAAAASGGMVKVVEGIKFPRSYVPEKKEWSKDYIIAGDNKVALKAYFNEERIEALSKLMRLKNLWTIFIFREEQVLLRVDTPNPLTNETKTEALLKKMLQTAHVLELKSGEGAMIKSDIINKPDTEDDVEAKVKSAGVALELEEDEVALETEEKPVEQGEESDEPKADKAE